MITASMNWPVEAEGEHEAEHSSWEFSRIRLCIASSPYGVSAPIIEPAAASIDGRTRPCLCLHRIQTFSKNFINTPGDFIFGVAAMLSIYETSEYADNNPTWHEEDAPWKARQIERMIRDNDVACDSICEVGSGTGEILLNLERAFPGSFLRGFEISPYAHDRAKQKETARTTFSLSDPLESPEADFDLVLVIDVVEHVEDYVSFIRSLKRLGKRKIFHIPLDISAQSVIRRAPIMQLRQNVGHLHYFFKDSALATLRDCGYRVLDHRYTASRLELPNQTLSSRLMRFPRRALYSISPDLTVRLLGGYSLLVLAE